MPNKKSSRKSRSVYTVLAFAVIAVMFTACGGGSTATNNATTFTVGVRGF